MKKALKSKGPVFNYRAFTFRTCLVKVRRCHCWCFHQQLYSWSNISCWWKHQQRRHGTLWKLN